MPKPRNGSESLRGLYDVVGGLEACRQLSHLFHERVAKDELLSKIFPKNMPALSEHFALFLSERLGGPATYTAKRGKQSLICRHAHLSISTDEAARWLAHMSSAINEAGISQTESETLRAFFAETAATLTDPFLPFYQLPLENLSQQIHADPSLLGLSGMGHSILRHAVSRWDAPRVKLLLESGASATTEEPLGHGLLYRVANAGVPGLEEQGSAIAEMLVHHGAEINKPSGPGKSSPIHMAARRGHVLLAKTLLKAGANIEARDTKGETPLRRAVNCQQDPMVDFLLTEGANPFSRDKTGRTPIDSARSEIIRLALQKAARQR